MRKILYVGDPHVKVSNLKDCEALINNIMNIAHEENVDQITFLGDMFHTHAVVRIEVINFWRKSLYRICRALEIKVICLVGNHDQPGSKEKEQEMNALDAIRGVGGEWLKIISSPTLDVETNISYMPYTSSEEHFLEETHAMYEAGNGKGSQCLIAHQTFTGAQYENGFFSEEGIDPGLVAHPEIISGHIHKCQQVGKCFYPGTPKWDTMSDANQQKGLYIITHFDDGSIIDKQFFDTSEIVSPIYSYEVNEGDELPEINPNARNHIVLKGKSAWIKKTKTKFPNCHVKVVPTDRATRKVDKKLTLENYLEKEFEPIAGVTKEDIKQFVSNL